MDTPYVHNLYTRLKPFIYKDFKAYIENFLRWGDEIIPLEKTWNYS